VQVEENINRTKMIQPRVTVSLACSVNTQQQ
jgi:hypothetical protein